MKVGVPHADAETTTDVIMQAERFGIPSHGLVRLPHYVRRIREGSINPQPQISVTKEGQCTALVDGDNGLGHVVSTFAMRKAIELAKGGSGFVAARRSSHFGIAGYYALMAAREGMIGLSLTLVDAIVAPYGGTAPFLGSNPIALAAPSEAAHPILLDISTSAVAWGKIIVAKARGEQIKSEWAIDREGRPTTDPERAHALLPMAGHKGYGLALFIELLCSALTGSPFGPHIPRMYGDLKQPRNIGHFFGALRIESFAPVQEFKSRALAMTNEIHQIEPAPGFDQVLVLGDIEFMRESEIDSKGFHIDSATLEQLKCLATELSVHFPGGK
jgi:ureidoglycolate dehydrogenase (NAD+)